MELYRRYVGEVCNSGIRKRKLTYNKEDGSTVVGYNITGEGYITSDVDVPSGNTSGFLSEIVFTRQGLFPTVSSGTESTHYCDGMWYGNSTTNGIPIRGGNVDSNYSTKVGAFYVSLGSANTAAETWIGASISAR